MSRTEQAWRRVNPGDSPGEYQHEGKLSEPSMISPYASLDTILLACLRSSLLSGPSATTANLHILTPTLPCSWGLVRSWDQPINLPGTNVIRNQVDFNSSCITCEPLNEHPAPRASGLRQIPGRCSGHSQIRPIYYCRILERKTGFRSGSGSPPLISSVCGTTYN